MSLALRSTNRLGYWYSVHTGAGVVPSMLCNRLILTGEFSGRIDG